MLDADLVLKLFFSSLAIVSTIVFFYKIADLIQFLRKRNRILEINDLKRGIREEVDSLDIDDLIARSNARHRGRNGNEDPPGS